uniref:RRM domain-containing protein n=1 Tax=Chromera velia CCMP2878 TaxID=1169474 RepID=A0A0G4HY73_9ALVE|eukprot:Cvel_9434.t1-p1 / transcript=Cvel_9434.t1 / gene=Cvel_9434 / organism=Chromera_velia_CCMP2878 / gene_product=DAZ-associated protein 1, putative / transcript_product=DAZ-associated protein 1, putative / location=Cvel_scaffold544:20118-25862(+) / protein_length=449 / sequence_SO=supercontig / SO=protein_coding / is_pseudo=false
MEDPYAASSHPVAPAAAVKDETKGAAPGAAGGQGSAEDEMAVYVSGLHHNTMRETIKDYFAQFGDLRDSTIFFDRDGTSKGEGIVRFKTIDALSRCLSAPNHIIEGRNAVVKKADQVAMPDRQLTKQYVKSTKCFVGGLPPTCDKEKLSAYFSQFGRLTDAAVMYEGVTRRPRGFGFVEFETQEAMEAVMANYKDHHIDGKWVEVKRAVNRDAPDSAYEAMGGKPPRMGGGPRRGGGGGGPRGDFYGGGAMRDGRGGGYGGYRGGGGYERDSLGGAYGSYADRYRYPTARDPYGAPGLASVAVASGSRDPYAMPPTRTGADPYAEWSASRGRDPYGTAGYGGAYGAAPSGRGYAGMASTAGSDPYADPYAGSAGYGTRAGAAALGYGGYGGTSGGRSLGGDAYGYGGSGGGQTHTAAARALMQLSGGDSRDPYGASAGSSRLPPRASPY